MLGNNRKVWGTLLASVGVNLASILALSAPSQAAFLYIDDSTIQNAGTDLSGDRLNPTDLGELMVGDNFLTITIANPPLPPVGPPPTQNRDLDYFTFTVPEGVNFSKAILEDYILGDNAGFLAIQAGDQFTQPPTPPIPPDGPADPSQLLGYSIYGTISEFTGGPMAGQPLPPNTVTNVGDDFMELMGLTQATGRAPSLPNGFPAPDPIGFTAPLPPGDYVFWAQQTTFLPAGSQLTQFTIRFVGTPIPEPTSIISLMGVAALALTMKRKHN